MPAITHQRWTFDDGIDSYADFDFAAHHVDHGLEDAEALEALRVHLEASAAIYRLHKSGARPPGFHEALREQLKRLAEQAELLHRRLQDLNEDARHLLHMAVYRDTERTAWDVARSREPKRTEIGQLIQFVEISEGVVPLFLEYEDIANTPALLSAYARRVMSDLPQGRKGRPTRAGLGEWVANFERAWTEIVKRPFTVQRHKGEPVSPAARFAVACFKVVDPEVLPSNVMTEMEYHKRDMRKRAADPNTRTVTLHFKAEDTP